MFPASVFYYLSHTSAKVLEQRWLFNLKQQQSNLIPSGREGSGKLLGRLLGHWL
jgi:hypothetical protein